MSDARALGDRRLRGTDIHSAIELHRIGVDDLCGCPAGDKPLGEIERQPRLAGTGRADDGDDQLAKTVGRIVNRRGRHAKGGKAE